MNRVGSGFVVGGTDILHIISRNIVSTDKHQAGIRCLFEESMRCRGHDKREQGYDNGRATPDGAIVVAAFAVVRVGLIWVGVAVELGFAGVVRVLDVLGELLGHDARRKWTAVEREEK